MDFSELSRPTADRHESDEKHDVEKLCYQSSQATTDLEQCENGR